MFAFLVVVHCRDVTEPRQVADQVKCPPVAAADASGAELEIELDGGPVVMILDENSAPSS